MVLGLLKNLPVLNSFLDKPAATKESLETEAAAKANEKAIVQEGLKPLFIVVLPAEGDFSELKAKLKEKFNSRDLHFEVDPELKKPKLYILKPNALAKRNSETALDKAFIKDNYRSIEFSGDGNKLGESLVRAMSTELVSLKGAERKIEYAQKEAEKANSRQTLGKLSKTGAKLASPAERLKAVGVNSCANGTCPHDHGGGRNSLDRNNENQLVRSFISVSSINNDNDNETVTEQGTSIKAQPVNNKDTVRRTTSQKTESPESHPDKDTSSKVENPQKKPQASTQEQGNQSSQANTQNKKTNNPSSPQTIINNIASAAESIINTGQTIIKEFLENFTSTERTNNDNKTVTEQAPNTQEQNSQSSKPNAPNSNNSRTHEKSSNPFSPQTIINKFIAIAEPLVDELTDKGQKIWNHFLGKPDRSNQREKTESNQNTNPSQKPQNIQRSPPSNNSAQLQTAQQRREDLKAFLTKLKDLGNDHSKHNELIQSSNSAYFIHNKNTNETFDLTKIEITFAHRENASDNFTIYRLPLTNFLNGDKLTISTEKMTHTDIHEREMHSKDLLQAEYMLSLLKQSEQNSNSTELNKIIENDFKSNLNKITNEIKTSLQKITAAAKKSFSPDTGPQKLNGNSILSQGGSFSNVNFTQIDTKQSQGTHLARESVNKSIRELLSNIFAQEYKSFKTSAKEVLSKFTPEETKQLNPPISQYFNEEINQSISMIKPMGAKNLRSDLKKDKIENYISSRIKISQQIDLLPRLMNEGFSYENNLKGSLEQSNQSSIHTNRQLAETKYLQNTTNNSGKKEHDKQVGGIALTGQFSFIDRKEFHERNKTYKDFPPLPESWKTEPKQTEPNTSQTAQNHESTSPVSTAADDSTKATETTAANINNSSPTSNESSPQTITEIHEEKQTIRG